MVPTAAFSPALALEREGVSIAPEEDVSVQVAKVVLHASLKGTVGQIQTRRIHRLFQAFWV